MFSTHHQLDRGIIDAHLHLDDSGGRTAAEAAHALVGEMPSCGVGHAVVLHLLWQPWSVEEVAGALAQHSSLTGFVNVDPRSANSLVDLQRGFELGFCGLKLHPRKHHFFPNDESCISLVRRAGELGMPVLIDCFPDGDWLIAGLSILQYASLARKAPGTKLVVAHAAGHHCLDLLMIAKRIPNLWFDVSYSLLYYASPVLEALLYCMESIRYERVTFGTDYPDRSLKTSIEKSLALLDRFGVKGEAREKVLWKNAYELLLKPSD